MNIPGSKASSGLRKTNFSDGSDGIARSSLCVVAVLLLVGLSAFLVSGAEQVEASENLMARSFGMGGAFTAVADDGSALFYNPAGLHDGGSLEVSAGTGIMVDNIFDYFELMALTEEFDEEADDPRDIIDKVDDIPALGVRGQLLGGGRVSNFGFAADIAGNIDGKILENGEDYDREGELNYEGLMRGKAGVAAGITEVPLGLGFLAVGGAVGINRAEMGQYSVGVDEDLGAINDSEMTEWRGSDTGIGADAGVMVQITPLVKAGAMMENIFAQSLEPTGDRVPYDYDPLEDEWTKEEDEIEEGVQDEYPLARKMRVGAAVDLPVFGTAAADISNVPVLSSDEAPAPVLHAGVESDLLLGLISVRGGFYRELGEDGYGMLTGGGGVNFGLGNVNLGAGFSPGEGTSSVLVSATLGF